MSFFIGDALAQGSQAAAGQPPSWMMPALMIGMFVMFYFLMIRPQQKRAKEHQAMAGGLKNGDEIITNAGILGRIVDASSDYLLLELNDNVQIRIQRNSVANLLPKGTIKAM